MLSRRVRENLDAMLQTPGFRVDRAGDTFFATAPGHRKKRLMYQGAVTTPAGQWMRDMRMVPLQADRVDPTRPTEFRGNSEFATTQGGKRVRLRGPQGLTERGKQVYQTAELTVEVPATQEGVNAKGDQFELDTYKVYTETDHKYKTVKKYAKDNKKHKKDQEDKKDNKDNKDKEEKKDNKYDNKRQDELPTCLYDHPVAPNMF